MRARVKYPADVHWQTVGSFPAEWWRRLTVRSRFSARLVRDGFHALAVLHSGGVVGAVPGAIVTLRAGDDRFQVSHRITRGTRPLHITAVPGGSVYWGEYFDNAARDEVHIYASNDGGVTWQVAYTFAKGSIRHVHNIVHDRWQHCLWIFTGDYGEECRILRADCGLRNVDIVMKGKQQTRAVAAVACENGLYFSTDTPLEKNFIYRLDAHGNLFNLAAVNSSSIYGCRVEDRLYFSTMVEPSEVNRDGEVHIYGVHQEWQQFVAWKKDRWPMGLFQYGNAMFPDGENATPYLAVTTIAVEGDDMVTSLYVEQTDPLP